VSSGLEPEPPRLTSTTVMTESNGRSLESSLPLHPLWVRHIWSGFILPEVTRSNPGLPVAIRLLLYFVTGEGTLLPPTSYVAHMVRMMLDGETLLLANCSGFISQLPGCLLYTGGSSGSTVGLTPLWM
jgi:hypothetical protein